MTMIRPSISTRLESVSGVAAVEITREDSESEDLYVSFPNRQRDMIVWRNRLSGESLVLVATVRIDRMVDEWLVELTERISEGAFEMHKRNAIKVRVAGEVRYL